MPSCLKVDLRSPDVVAQTLLDYSRGDNEISKLEGAITACINGFTEQLGLVTSSVAEVDAWQLPVDIYLYNDILISLYTYILIVSCTYLFMHLYTFAILHLYIH